MSAWNKETIKDLRRKLKMSQADLAVKLGCRQQTISEWELGIYAPANAYTQLLNMLAQDTSVWSSTSKKEIVKEAMVLKAQQTEEVFVREFDPAID